MDVAPQVCARVSERASEIVGARSARRPYFPVNEMEKNHGVDMNRMNAELVRALNSGGKGVVVTAAKHSGMQTYFGSDALVLRVAMGGSGGEGDGSESVGVFSSGTWDVVREACTAVLQRHIAHIPKCRCGF